MTAFNCHACGDTGLHFVPTFVAGTADLSGHTVERCYACGRYPSDLDAAQASGCTFDEEGVEVFVMDECPPESVVACRDAQLRDDPDARRLWEAS